jgi:hypothetical protein
VSSVVEFVDQDGDVVWTETFTFRFIARSLIRDLENAKRGKPRRLINGASTETGRRGLPPPGIIRAVLAGQLEPRLASRP